MEKSSRTNKLLDVKSIVTKLKNISSNKNMITLNDYNMQMDILDKKEDKALSELMDCMKLQNRTTYIECSEKYNELVQIMNEKIELKFRLHTTPRYSNRKSKKYIAGRKTKKYYKVT